MAGYEPDWTIAAIATAPGRSALGLLRLSGSGAWRIAAACVPQLPSQPVAQHAYVLSLSFETEGVQIEERAVVTLWRGPQSYTGEDMAEFSLHGNPLLLRAALASLVAAGARLADPGEFTYRAFLHGKLDLMQAEAVQRLISAGNLRELAQAGAALQGLQSKRIQGWEEQLTLLLAGIEVIHDYAADDLDASLDQEALLTPQRVATRLTELRSELAAALESLKRSAGQRSGITVAICGPPNVGKSTLFNALLGHERALTAPTPGTTRDYLAEPLEAGGLSFVLVDTAGQRESGDALEQAGIELARGWAGSADILLWVRAADDAEQAYSDVQNMSLEQARVDVLTRCDLLPDWPERAGQLCVSGRSGQGVAALWQCLQALAEQLSTRETSSLGDREGSAIAEANTCIDAALQAIRAGMPLDAVATEIYRARRCLHLAWQSEDRDGVISAIFSGFCVGK